MAPQWMPQNIQKRLLLYVLQQLSLFSEIDLTNLDVSLGSNSQITLTNVQIDTELLNIPGLYFRNGSVQRLNFKLNMSDGVNIEGEGLSLTVSLASPLSNSTSLSQSEYNGEKSKFSLAQSTIDLANSIMVDDDPASPYQSVHESLETPISSSPNTKDQQQSTLNSMMSKAVEVALSKLNVTLKDINLRVVLDDATLDVYVENAAFVTVDGVKNVEISEISVVGVHPNADRGEEGSSETEIDKKDSTDEKHADSVSASESESESESDDDTNDAYQSMITSSILERPEPQPENEIENIAQSHVTDHDDDFGSSIYMSATSNVFETRRKDLSNTTKLLYISFIKLDFEGTGKPENLNVLIDEIRISATPLPLTLLYIVESLSSLSSNTSGSSRFSNVGQKLKEQRERQQQKTASGAPEFLNSLKIDKIKIDFVSALNDSGEFCLKNSLRMVCEKIDVQVKGSKLIYGNIHTFKLVENGKNISFFEGDETRFDIRFELKLSTNNNDFTLLLPKNFELHLSQSNLQAFLKLSAYFPQIQESLNKQKSTTSSHSKQISATIQTSLITTYLHITPESTLKLKLSPISYCTKESSLLISKIQLLFLLENDEQPLLSIFNSSLQSHKSEKQVRSYDNNGHETMLSTKLSLSVKNVTITQDFKRLCYLGSALEGFFGGLSFPEVERVFKPKRVRISSHLTYETRQSVNLFAQIGSFPFKISDIADGFGDIEGNFSNLAFAIQKDNSIQIHIINGEIFRKYYQLKDSILEIINPDDKSAPIISAKTKNFKDVNVFLRNVSLDYHSKWLSIFDNKESSELKSSEVMMSSGSSSKSPLFELKLNLVDCGLGLNPSRLSAKAVLVIPNGNIDISISQSIVVRSVSRNPSLLLIDDTDSILSHDEAKRSRNIRTTWSQATFLKTKGFCSVAEADSIDLVVTLNKLTDITGNNITRQTLLEIDTDSLNIELCADSSQCLIQVMNDLKQPIAITPESKYRIDRTEGINIFDDIEENAFNEYSTIDHITDSSSSTNEPLNFVDSYYNTTDNKLYASSSDNLIDKDLSELAIKETTLDKNPYSKIEITNSLNGSNSTRSENSDSIILFNDGHFEEDSKKVSVENTTTPLYPLILNLSINTVTLKIYDGYDWSYTRKSITNAVTRLENKVKEQQASRPQNPASEPVNNIIGETLFDSIIVGLPVNSENPSELTTKINKNLQSIDDTIEVGKKNMKKLKLRRSKFHKVLIELFDISVIFTIFSNQDPAPSDAISSDIDDCELINSTEVVVKDFEITDNVPTSTWNKFVTILKEVERESNSSMLKFTMKTVRPVISLAATEFLMDVEVLPLRLHVDQDTLEVLVRFGEFKDRRFLLIDEYEDIAYIQKFHINAIPIKLDYKPKKVDYSGLRSGRTTEFMNFFILDEASMVLKEVTLYGISGFPRLGLTLNSLWTPDIKKTQLGGVLAGLAPVRSIANIGAGFKDLIVVPVQEYKKDGRVYRSLSKGVQQFTKNSTNEILKLGIKLAAGTQTLLENTEEALGGYGSNARLPIETTTIPEEDEEDEEDDNWNLQSSQLIGKTAPSNQHSFNRSIYQPTLESIADINDYPYGTPNYTSPRRTSKRIIRQKNTEIDGFDEDDETQRTISLYANQPKSLKEGLLLAYDSLGRNFIVARDAIYNAGTEIGESGTAHDTAIAVVKAAPVALLRPMIGATEAASKALLGINNQFDPTQDKYIDDKYKQWKK